MSASPERMRRLFFALWPTAAMQEALILAAERTLRSLRSGRPVLRENLHLTLAFIGSVPDSALRALEDIASHVSPPGAVAASRARAVVEMSFDSVEYWPRSEILCAAASHAPSEAAAFAEALKQGLSSGSFAPDLKPFRAHVTLARQVKRRPAERTLTAVTWTFSDFALIESRSTPAGSLYSVVATWPLYSA
jgi:RNA 2',3'-cyclic 3'-phosphodiesterase